MADRRDQIEDLFKASLGFGFEREKDAGDFFEESKMMKLASGAGVEIPNPTYDKIVSYVSELMSRDLTDLTAGEVGSTIEFTASKQQGLGSNLIDQGEGVVKIFPFEGNEDIVLEVPFLVINGNLAPFDVIQFQGQRAPYTRENLGKALNALIAQGDPNKEGIQDGYVQLEKMHNPSTSEGFMADTLNVRHRGNVIPDIGGMFVTASEKKIDGLLKKAATLSPVDWSKVEAAAEALAAKNYQRFIKEASDEGEEISMMIKTAAHNSDISRTLPWKNVKNVASKTFIKFPVYEDHGVTMMAGLVLKDLSNPMQKDRDGKMKDAKYFIVITADGRVRAIYPEDEGFICLESSEKLFKLPGCFIDGLRRTDSFIVKTPEGNLTVPYYILQDSIRAVNTKPPQARREEETLFSDKDRRPADLLSRISIRKLEVKDAYNKLSSQQTLFVAPTEKPMFQPCNKEQFKACLSKKSAAELYKLDMILPDYQKDFWTVSKGKRLIAVNGEIPKTFTSLNEVEALLYREKTADEDFDTMMKTASLSDTITVTKLQNGKYNIKVKYQDKTEQMFRAAEETLEGLSESAAIGALIALNFTRSTATDLMVKVNHGSQVSCSLPANSNPSKIFSSKKHKIKKAVAEFKRAGAGKKVSDAIADLIVDKGKESVAKKIVSPVVQGVLKDTALVHNQGFINTILDKAASLRDEAQAISSVFEKRAVAEENGTMRKCAKAMALCAHFNNDCMKVLKDPDNYPQFTKLAAEVAAAKPILEEVVDDLLTEKLAYYKENENHPMSVSFYSSAIGNMDQTYQIASHIAKR